MVQFPDSNLFVEFISPAYLTAARSDLKRLLEALPIQEADKLPHRFDPEKNNWRVPELNWSVWDLNKPGTTFTAKTELRATGIINGQSYYVHVQTGSLDAYPYGITEAARILGGNPNLENYALTGDYGREGINCAGFWFQWFINERARRIQKDRAAILTVLDLVENLYSLGYKKLLEGEYHQALAAFNNYQNYIMYLDVFNEITNGQPDPRLAPALSGDIYYSGISDHPLGGLYIPYNWFLLEHGGVRLEEGGYRFTLPNSQLNPMIPQGSPGLGFFEKNGGHQHFWDYTLWMLKAEAYRGLGDNSTAAVIYADLLAGTPGRFQDPTKEIFIRVPLSYEDNEQVRIRSGLNQIQWGDRFFAHAYNLSGPDQAAELVNAKSHYQAALDAFAGYNLGTDIMEAQYQIELLEQEEKEALWKLTNPHESRQEEPQSPMGFSTWGRPPHPLALEIATYAQMQLAKLAGNLNFLGFSEAFVPVQRYKFLLTHAKESANLAIQSEQRAIEFKKHAEDQELLRRGAAQEAELSDLPVQIAQSHYQDAESRIKQDDSKIKEIEDKINSLQDNTLGTIFGFLGMAVAICAAPFTGGSSVAVLGAAVTATSSFISGRVSADASAQGQINDLYYQKQALLLDKPIAARQRMIAAREMEAAKRRSEYLNMCAQYLRDKEMNSDVYFALASTLKRVSHSYLQAGISMGYLAERALAFELDQSGLHFVKLDYDISELNNLLGGDLLLNDLKVMDDNRTLSVQKENHVKHIISLRERFPVEFIQLLHTGQTAFNISLYELDKAYPGTYQQRLKQVEVVINAPKGTGGCKGSLTHSGAFLMRHLKPSLSDAADRLLPTEEQLAKAYAQLSVGKLASIEVGGVEVWHLPPAHRILSDYNMREDAIVFPASDETLDIFEGYGPNGLWQLELSLETNSIDLGQISDIRLVLYFDAQYDESLEHKLRGYYDTDKHVFIEGLIQRYERELTGNRPLDEIALFSLCRRFGEAFKNFEKGAVDFELVDADFPSYMINKQVSKIIIQALDDKGKGIPRLEMLIKREPDAAHPFSASLTTLEDGFTEDLHSPKTGSEQESRFNWEAIPGKDSAVLLGLLIQRYHVKWLPPIRELPPRERVALKIERMDNGKTIRISKSSSQETREEEYILLKLIDDIEGKEKVRLEISDGRTDEFIAKREGPALNVYFPMPVPLVPLTGRWRIETANIALAKGVKDLLACFLYSYENKQSI